LRGQPANQENDMKWHAPVAAAGVAAALCVLGWTQRGPDGTPIVESDAPLPFDRKVEVRFQDEESGAEEAWVFQKKHTTRDESLSRDERRLPEAEPADADRAVDESARALDGMGREAWRGGDPENALGLLEQAVEADPDDWVPRASYGRLLALTQDFPRAREQLERAAELAPDDPQRWLDLQSLYERQLDLELAFAARRRAEQLAPDAVFEKDWAGQYVIQGGETIP
jgi:tetratricopeptide (TPR) repeat protein